MFNLLTEPLIRITTADGTCVASLPEVYAALMADAVDAFPALRPHQRHAWHAFLVQLGAMVMQKAGVSEPPADAAEWVTLIRGLTPDWPDDEPWQLVVDDITKPAFMQPPASSKDRKKNYEFIAKTPDDLDILETSKNHDLKSAVAQQSYYDDWLIGLISVQTQGGRGDRYYQGISRMKGSGYSRTAFCISQCKDNGSYSFGLHVKRDMTVLTQQWKSLIEVVPDFLDPTSGHKLLWTVVWDGTKTEAILPNTLHPLYVEVCRLIRMELDAHGGLYGRKATSLDAPRIQASSLKGQVGDPWTAIDTNGEALGLRAEGFSYRRIVDCFDSTKFRLPFLCYPTELEQMPDTKVSLIARGVARFSEGPRATTAGYQERIIPLRHKVVQIFGMQGGPQKLGDIARERIEQVSTVRRILLDAIATFVVQGKDIYTLTPQTRQNLRSRDDIQPWLKQLDEIVDTYFFDKLQTEFEADDDKRKLIRNEWLKNGKDGVVDHASNILRAAEDVLPCPAIHRYKARVQADSSFWRWLHGSNGLPTLFHKSSEEGKECRNSVPAAQAQNPTGAQMPLFQ